MRPPFAIIALLISLVSRLLERRSCLPPINWRETAEHATHGILAEMLLGGVPEAVETHPQIAPRTVATNTFNCAWKPTMGGRR